MSWLRRRVPRYCAGCGHRMRRRHETPASIQTRYDPATGRPVHDWWWGCYYSFFPWGDLAKHQRQRIRVSGARARLAVTGI